MDGTISEQLYDELDTSVEFGSGVICLAGPPGSGKTTLLLNYLAAREDSFVTDTATQSVHPTHARTHVCSPVLHTEYMTARSISTGVWTYLAHRILHHLHTQQEQRLRAQMRRRHARTPHTDAAAGDDSQRHDVMSSLSKQQAHKRGPRRKHYGDVTAGREYSALEFAHVVLQWVEAQEQGSELHLVVDDADTLDGYGGGSVGGSSTQPQQLDMWLSSGCLTTLSASPGVASSVYMWVISQLPLQLRHCFRYHTLEPPSTAVMLFWLDGMYAEHAASVSATRDGEEMDETDVHMCGRKRLRRRCDCFCASAHAEQPAARVERDRGDGYSAHETGRDYDNMSDSGRDSTKGDVLAKDDATESRHVRPCCPEDAHTPMWTDVVDGHTSVVQRRVSAQQAHAWVRQGVEYYTTHQPMSTSLVSRDIRQLLQRIDTVLPALIMARGAQSKAGGGALHIVEALCDDATAVVAPVNAIQLAAAWGMYTELWSAQDGCAGSSGATIAAADDIATSSSMSIFARAAAAAATAGRYADPLVQALKQLGYSAVLLAFVAFYCGAVPPNKQYQALAPHHHSHRTGNRRGCHSKSSVHETSAQSHRATVLSASAHVIAVAQLIFVYTAVREVCAATVDTRELVSAEVAMHHVSTLVSWGLLTPVLTQQTRSYHCWIAVSTAQLLGYTLGINIFDLIPN